MRRIIATTALVTALSGLCSGTHAQDAYSKDTPADTGAEPNPDTGPMWVSEDIWIRSSPDPNYRPVPFTEASPPWTPAPHQNPEYRDPKYGIPNYVYVRIRNRGTAPSAGTEQLRVYWAKASAGLSWPTSWNDAYGPVCGTNRLLGAEITKPRKNAATATDAERAAYRAALLQIASTPAFTWLTYSYWTKQQQVHRFSPEHKNAGFLPWHREYIHRYEVLLQQADPRVKLLYWNWSTDPAPTSGTSLFTSTFMGNSGRGGATGMGAPLVPALNPHSSDPPAAVVRNLSTGPSTPEGDATVLARTNYRGTTTSTNNFSRSLELTPNHDSRHTYIGGGTGDMGDADTAARDPFFFLLHGKADELWARWQRANTSRQESGSAYGTSSGDTVITGPMHPWDGTLTAGGSIDPWTTTGGFIVSKTSLNRSVVSPPIYDTAPLTIPALAPGQAVILEIPWYPPNPDHYSCLGDMRHFCLLSRITPGITTAEGTDVNLNVRNNNNLAWKNIQIVDDFTGTMAAMSLFVQNDTDAPMQAGLLLRAIVDANTRFSDQVAAVFVGLPPDLYRRWREGGSRQENLRPARQMVQRDRLPKATYLQLTGDSAVLDNIALQPGERFPLHLAFQLKPDYTPSRDVLAFDVVQRNGTDAKADIVGGVQYRLDLSKLVLVKERGRWRYLARGGRPPKGWTASDFDDRKWNVGPAPFGFGQRVEAMAGVPATQGAARVAYFRTRFDTPDPALLRNLTLRTRYDDGVVLYLNGREVYRANVPVQQPVSGAAEQAFFVQALPTDLLAAGTNVLAVEVHQAAKSDDDMVFDAELAANHADPGEPPSVAFLSLDEGALLRAGAARKVEVDAIDPDGKIRQVAFFVDDQRVATRDAPPFVFEWTPEAGAHRLRALAIDDRQRTATQEVLVTGVANVPPIVRMRADPGPDAGTLTLSAEATDPDGQIREVAFFLAESGRFDAPMVPVGKVSAPPFRVTIRVPEGAHRIATAVATDDGGETGEASTHLRGAHANAPAQAE